MPFPLLALLVGAAGTIGGKVSYDVGEELLKRKVRAYFEQYADEFFAAAVDEMGLSLSQGGNLTDESLTALVNQKLLAGSGVQIDSLLDRDKLRAGLEKLAIGRLAEVVGVPVGAGQGIGAVKSALQSWAVDEVKKQLADEAGPVFEAAPGSPFIAKVVAGAVKVEGWNTPTDLTAKGAANRQRQAKYRHSHKKTWVPK